MRIDRLGECAVVFCESGAVSVQTQQRILNLAVAARTWLGVQEAVPGMHNLTVFAEQPAHVPQIEARLREAWPRTAPQYTAGKIVEIPVRYGGADGPDLSAVAAACRCSDADVIAIHSGREYVAFFLGFQPGFAYLGDLDERLRLPRRDQPRAGVPAGSVAIAEHMTAVYPATSPGGWHAIGRTAMQLFDPRLDAPALIQPGDRVRFVRASE